MESGIQLKGMLNAADDWNPESTGQPTNYWNPVPGIRNPQRGIQTPRLSRIPFKYMG